VTPEQLAADPDLFRPQWVIPSTFWPSLGKALAMFNADGSLTPYLSSEEPADAVGKANWLPAPDGGFALALRTYVPTEALLDGSYTLPNIVRPWDAPAVWIDQVCAKLVRNLSGRSGSSTWGVPYVEPCPALAGPLD